MSAPGLEAVLARSDVWKGHRAAWAEFHPTGFDKLDAALDGGWPVGVLIECLGEHGPGGQIALFLPILKQMMRGDGRVMLIDPPFWPYAPALVQAEMALSRLLVLRPASTADWLWAGVQCLESGACRAVLLWNDDPGHRALRRLQLAAESHYALAVLFRAPSAARQASPAALRLAVRPHPECGLNIDVLKCHGRPPQTLQLSDVASVSPDS